MEVFFEKNQNDLISRCDTDAMLQKIAEDIIVEIQKTQSSVATQKFFDTVEAIQNPIYRGGTLARAFNVFSKVIELQWIALESLKKNDSKYRDGYFII